MVVFHRRLPKFGYLAPKTLDEALELLASYKSRVKVMAGGTDLLPKIKTRKIQIPEYIIDLKNIANLDQITYHAKKGLTLGPLVTIRTVEKSLLIREKYPILSEAAENMASIQVRNRGTVAGNICNAVPSADLAPALLNLEASVKLVSNKGKRTVKMEDFFTGPNQTVAGDDELLTEIHMPVLPAGNRGTYIKLSPRRAMDLAIVGVAVSGIIEKGVFKDIRISLAAAAPTPIRVKPAENILRGQKISPEIIERAAEKASQESQPIDDHRASAEYRRDMVKVLTRRALEKISKEEKRDF
jgi:CO/xanthine dehydrogenase FAD-binding subunit